MVESVKGRREIEKTQASDMLTGGGTDEMVIEGQECSFRRMELGISRLEDVVE